LGDVLKDRVMTSAHADAINGELRTACNEVYLWHGCAPKAATGIFNSGFDLGLAGTGAGSMLGNCVYLAESPTKSDEYTDGGEDDTLSTLLDYRCLLLCRVVLGAVLQLPLRPPRPEFLTRLMTQGDPADGFMALGGYHSVMYTGAFREFGVYDADGVYPEYLVLYSRRFGEEPKYTISVVSSDGEPQEEIAEQVRKLSDLDAMLEEQMSGRDIDGIISLDEQRSEVKHCIASYERSKQETEAAWMTDFPSIPLSEYEEEIDSHKTFLRINTSAEFSARIQVIERAPWLMLIHDFLSEAECLRLIQQATPSLLPSEKGRSSSRLRRTSMDTRLSDAPIQSRCAHLLNLPLENLEELKVIRYQKGQCVDAHWDRGGRAAALFMYLNDVEHGGETCFTFKGVYKFYWRLQEKCEVRVRGAWHVGRVINEIADQNGGYVVEYGKNQKVHINRNSVTFQMREYPAPPPEEQIKIRPKRGLGVLHFPCYDPDSAAISDTILQHGPDPRTGHLSLPAVDEKFIAVQWAQFDSISARGRLYR